MLDSVQDFFRMNELRQQVKEIACFLGLAE
jgi:hypothetical protein